MKYTKALLIALIATFFIVSCTSPTSKVSESAGINKLSESEISEGWELLFDGETLNGWRSFLSDTIHGWVAEDGYLTALGKGGGLSRDIITKRQFADFELYLEWKIAHGGNSGIMFRVLEEGRKTTHETGPEYQIIDDQGYPHELQDWQKTGANYGMHYNEDKVLNPIDEFNSTKIVVNGPKVQHWLNDKLLFEYELWTEEWKQMVIEGKWDKFPDYGLAEKGHIALQYHGSKVWFRNIKIRELN